MRNGLTDIAPSIVAGSFERFDNNVFHYQRISSIIESLTLLGYFYAEA